MLNKTLDIAKSIPYIRGQQRVAAVALDKRGRVLASKTNSYIKTHPVQAEYAEKTGNPDKCFLHAEIRCIIAAQKVGEIHKIVVARAGKSGMMLPSKPCVICTMAIQEAGIKEVEYYEN